MSFFDSTGFLGTPRADIKKLVEKFEKWSKEFNEIASRQGIEPNVYHHYSGNARAYERCAQELKNLMAK